LRCSQLLQHQLLTDALVVHPYSPIRERHWRVTFSLDIVHITDIVPTEDLSHALAALHLDSETVEAFVVVIRAIATSHQNRVPPPTPPVQTSVGSSAGSSESDLTDSDEDKPPEIAMPSAAASDSLTPTLVTSTSVNLTVPPAPTPQHPLAVTRTVGVATAASPPAVSTPAPASPPAPTPQHHLTTTVATATATPVPFALPPTMLSYKGFPYEIPHPLACGPYYCVTKGRRVGVLATWYVLGCLFHVMCLRFGRQDTSPQVTGVRGAIQSRCDTVEEGEVRLKSAIERFQCQYLP
jgi:hypothetical protein